MVLEKTTSDKFLEPKRGGGEKKKRKWRKKKKEEMEKNRSRSGWIRVQLRRRVTEESQYLEMTDTISDSSFSNQIRYVAKMKKKSFFRKDFLDCKSLG